MASTTADETAVRAKAATQNTKTAPLLSPREQEVLLAAWICIKGADPQVDTTKLARVLNLKNSHTANTTLCIVKKKIKSFRESVEQDQSPVSSSTEKNISTPRKRASGNISPGTPTKRAKESANSMQEQAVENEESGAI